MKILNSPTIRRMPTYLHRLFRLRMSGQEWVSCAELAQYMNIPHIMVRKDIAMTGLPGHKRHGFKVVELIDAILQLLNWDKTSSATLVGAGSLGAALLGFDEFQSYNFRIESVFDSSPDKIGKVIHGHEIYDLAEIRKRLKLAPPKVGIICVPAVGAQLVADILISLGIKYIWNFSNVCLSVPPGVIVQREVIAGGLAVLFAKINKAESGNEVAIGE
ncbi:MAG: redox-sensing transcriptional repressor Rex [Lentisphaeria bacterium]|nr:redox-sensing transcriptional repressor Rex [Lentisphaeria bacterium]MBR2642447.1 redox-sensing transcriptional repressor Rex [Lentisphaeria bacterium]